MTMPKPKLKPKIVDAISLNNFDSDDFLANYWQQKPLLIRNAMEDFRNPISADELAGLACEEEVESRLIIEDNNQWQLQHGPFNEESFQQLPEHNWTLLVQAVDHYVPAVAKLRRFFQFIPNWRIDDIMVSYASRGGSVGPHFDNYDVFLIQGQGQRHWQVGEPCSAASSLQTGQPLSLLSEFNQQQQWQLQAGDILYLPPLYSHWGVAQSDDCMTYSVGFRAPSHGEILADFCDDQLAQLSDQLRYQDPQLPPQDNPGELTPAAIAQVQSILQQQLANSDAISQWFGRYMTRPKYALDDDLEAERITLQQLQDDLASASFIHRDSATRFAFTHQDDDVILFINGVATHCQQQRAQLAQLLAASDHYPVAVIAAFLRNDDCQRLLLDLFSRGDLYIDSDILD